jgi:hypothetical protein
MIIIIAWIKTNSEITDGKPKYNMNLQLSDFGDDIAVDYVGVPRTYLHMYLCSTYLLRTDVYSNTVFKQHVVLGFRKIIFSEWARALRKYTRKCRVILDGS